MSQTPPEISDRIRTQLSLTAPGLSCELGTPERKIIDAVSEAISEAYVDQYLMGSLLDIETKTGLELEQFVGIFGYGRLQGQAAEGVVRITLNTAAPQDYEIPLGSQFYTKSGVAGASLAGEQPLFFASTEAVVLTAGNYSVDVPVRCTVVGTVGNVPPDSIVYLGSVIGSGAATNLSPLTGGINVETDSELRQRFKDTMLRNAAGTTDYYRALCLQNNRVSKVAVFGATSLYRTQIVAPATSTALSVSQDVKYIWSGMHSCFANYGQEDAVFYSPIYDYGLSSGPSPPTYTRHDTGEIEDGQVVDLEFQYTTNCSRNNPAEGITDKIDIFIDGIDTASITEKTVVTSTALSSSSGHDLYTGKFERVGSAGTPSAGNRFMRLGSVPVVSFPPTISVGETVFTQGVHYHRLRDITLREGSHVEVSGIEWDASGPDNGTEFTLTYTYNQAPEVLAQVMSHAKQVGSDVMIHQARFWHVQPCLSVQYDRSYAVSVTNAAIEERLKSYFASLPFGTHIKLSTLALAVQQVLGVLDVKITTGEESPTTYGVRLFNDATDPVPDTIHTEDFKLEDNALAVYSGVEILRKAAP